MPKKIKLKTEKTAQSANQFVSQIENATLKKDCQTLLKLFKKATGTKPKMWGPSIVGFHEYIYKRSNGAEGIFFATGFSPRKSGPTLYIMSGFQNYKEYLKKLGPHKLSKSCLYLKNLENIDLKTLEKLIKFGLKDLKKTHKTDY